MSLKFYDVDVDYVNYLKEQEKKQRGFTRVPDVVYHGSEKRKMVCGIVLEINGFKYYVPVSSNKDEDDYSLPIILEDDNYNPLKGSLRFRFMIPIEDKYITERDFKKETKNREIFLHRQLVYCNKIEPDIKDMAQKTYDEVNCGKDKKLVRKCCAFKLLEKACLDYSLRAIDEISNETEAV